MFQYVIKRMFVAIPVLFTISTIVFLLIHIIPGDPVDLIVGEQAFSADRARLAHELHLDEPLLTQYGRYMNGLVRGDLGESIYDHRSVMDHISAKYGATLLLATCAMFFAVMVAIPIGVMAAVKKGGFRDQAAMVVALIGISVPNFWLGPVLILIFSVWIGVLPISGRESLTSLILPSLTLGAALAAMLSRLTRSSMIEEINKEYVTAARAKGLSERKVIFKHAFRNALNPVVTIIGLQVGSLLAGTIITEKIFNWPGIGTLLMESIGRRDYPVVQGCILVIAFAYVIINVITDCMYRAVDPRVKF